MNEKYHSPVNSSNIMIFAFISVVLIFLSANVANGLDREIVSQTEIEAIALSKTWEPNAVKQAVSLFKQTAEDWQKLNEPQNAVNCLNEAAKLSQIYSDHETTFHALDKAISIARKNKLIDEEIVSASLYAFFSNEKNDQKASQTHRTKALLLSDQTNSPKAKAYSHFCNGIYEYYYGKMTLATIFFEQSAVYAQETQDIFIISQTLFYVGFAYIRDGFSDKALGKMNLALQLCEKFDYKKGQALSYFGIAASYYFNEKQKALDNMLKADSLFPNDFEWMEKARIATTIGNLYMDLGEFDLAEIYLQKAISNHDKANYLLGKITTLTLLADTFLLKADFEKAKQTYELALHLTALTGDKFRSAIIKEGLGNLEFKKNNLASAINHYSSALQQYNQIGVKMPVIENMLGNVYSLQKNFKKAGAFYNSALKTNRQTKDHLQESETLYNISKLHLLEINQGEALQNIRESIDLTENLYSDIANSNLKSSYLSNVFDRYKLLIDLLMKMQINSTANNYAVEALQIAEKSRARSLAENLSLDQAHFGKDADPETVKRQKEIGVLLNTKADKLTDLLSQNAEKSETDKISDEINELGNELENIKAKLKQQSPIYSAIKNPAPFDVAEFQDKILDENSLLLEFSFGKDESYLWLVGKNKFTSYILPPREQIENQIDKLRSLIASREMKKDEQIEEYQSRIKVAEDEYKKQSRELSNVLFGQITGEITNKRLIIVPDGKLHYFPISALPLPNSDSDEPILLTNETVYEPSAQTLLILQKSRNQTVSTTKKLLIFSDPIFTSDDARLSNQEKLSEKTVAETAPDNKFRFVESLNSLTRLTASKDESETITNIVGASDTDNFSGFAANRENMLNVKASDYKLIHFATHGLTDEKRPELSGIVLSRFNENGEKRDELFRIHDIYGLNLNADLVVLSACETGLGKEVKGEGLMSLNNAFLQVGAKSVMASLWKVEDGATLELMNHFYSAMADENLTPPQALRKAQIKLRQIPQYQSPFYWAAFTIQGDFKNVPKISREYGAQKYLFAFVPLLLLIGI